MSLRLEIGGISKDDDKNIYTIQLRCIRDVDNKLVGSKEFEASSPAGLKSKVKPIFEALVEAETNRENIRAIAQSVIDEIMAEVVQ